MSKVSHTNESTSRFAAGFTLGTLLGFTPLFNLHNLLAVAILVVFRISARTFLLGWLIAIPVGFLLDPVFDAIGGVLLSAPPLQPFWEWATNTPVLPLSAFNNTVTLGSLVFWLVAATPLFLGARWATVAYRGGLEALLSPSPLLKRLAEIKVIRRFLGLDYPQTGLVRKGFVIPLVTLGILCSLSWWLWADRGARLVVESGGETIWGAQVDVRDADIDLSEGRFALTGIGITDPDTPQQNLVSIGSMIADINTTPLLEAKIAIDSIIVRDVRFRTARETPGRVDTTRERGAFFREQMDRWRATTQIPPIPNPNFGSLVDLSALDASSLETVAHARTLAVGVDSARTSFDARLRAVDPTGSVDSVRALLAGLEGATPASLGPAGVARASASLRSAVSEVDARISGLNNLRRDFRAQADRFASGLARLNELKANDYRRAMGVVHLPSLDPDDISASLLQGTLMDRVENLVYWVGLIDRYLPSGSEPFRIPGPRRLRRSGRRFVFPDRDELPLFAVNKIESSVVLGDLSGFTASLFDLNSDQPSVGRPTVFRLLGESGRTHATVEAVVDRLGEVASDELRAEMIGLPLPSFDIAPLGARLTLGAGDTRAAISRSGDSLTGVVRWTSSEARWEPLEGREPATGATALVWRVVSSLQDIDVQVRLGGTLRSPRVAVSSSIGRQATSALRAQLGDELRAAETRVRAEVDRLVEGPRSEVANSVTALESRANRAIDDNLRGLESLKASLERRLRQLVPTLPGIGR